MRNVRPRPAMAVAELCSGAVRGHVLHVQSVLCEGGGGSRYQGTSSVCYSVLAQAVSAPVRADELGAENAPAI